MHKECVTVHFPGKKGDYQIPVSAITDAEWDRLEENENGCYDLTSKADEKRLWKFAHHVRLGNAELDDRLMESERISKSSH